jgi:hypothetical protein
VPWSRLPVKMGRLSYATARIRYDRPASWGFLLMVWSTQALVSQNTSAFLFQPVDVETDCYRVPVAANNVENDGVERVEANWTGGVLFSGISRAGEFVSPGQ